MGHRIIIAGIPRSGTTYLTRVIQNLPLGNVCPHNNNCIGIRNIKKSILNTNYKFYKTHDFAPLSLPPDIKCIFLFSDPMDAVISTIHHRFFNSHFLNCHCNKEKISNKQVNIIDRDDLNYEKMFTTWTKPNKGYPVLILRYETLKEYHSDMEDFLGYSFRMKEWKPRQHYRINKKIKKRIEGTYFNLIKMINNFPNMKLLK